MEILAWMCPLCDQQKVSYARNHHEMTMCGCGKAGVDLEEYMCRYVGQPMKLENLDDEDYAFWLELSLNYKEQFETLDCPHEQYVQLLELKDELYLQLAN